MVKYFTTTPSLILIRPSSVSQYLIDSEILIPLLSTWNHLHLTSPIRNIQRVPLSVDLQPQDHHRDRNGEGTGRPDKSYIHTPSV
jgi:hypothetical protein